MENKTSIASTPVTPSSSSVHPEDPCKNCVKPTSPFPREITSFLLLLFIGATTVLGVLFINEKRASAELNRKSADSSVKTESTTTTTSPTPYPTAVPAEKKFTETVTLPAPKLDGTVSLEKSVATRRSWRTFTDEKLTLDQLGQVLWSGQGVTDKKDNLRAAPSARELYPFTLYVVVRNVESVKPGLYQYLPDQHALGNLNIADAGEGLIRAEVQDHSKKSPVVILFSAAFGKTATKFPDPKPAVYMEAGHISENIYLQVEALGLGTVSSAGFNSQKVNQEMKLDPTESVIYMMPVGVRAPEPTPTP